MNQYYTQVYYEEQFLNATEIAEIYGIYTDKDIPHSRLIKVLLNNNTNTALTKEEYKRPFYIQTDNGLARVYPQCIYEQVMQDFLKKCELIKGNIKAIQMMDENKMMTFKFKIKK